MSKEFRYSYKAPSSEERKEIESIRNEYSPSQQTHNDGLSLLRSLHSKVKNTPKALSISIGVIGLLIFGLGLSMILEWNIILWGVIIAILGLIFTFLAN